MVYSGFNPTLTEMLDKVQCNVLFFPAKDDVDCVPFVETLKSKGFEKSRTKRYDDQIHGFMAARGDWNKPEVKAAVEEVLTETLQLFKVVL